MGAPQLPVLNVEADVLRDFIRRCETCASWASRSQKRFDLVVLDTRAAVSGHHWARRVQLEDLDGERPLEHDVSDEEPEHK